MNQKGVIHLAVPLILLLILAVVIFIFATGIIKIPLKSLPVLPSVKPQEPTVTLQKQYQNPFDKSTQYVNPFSTYKNPFDSLK